MARIKDSLVIVLVICCLCDVHFFGNMLGSGLLVDHQHKTRENDSRVIDLGHEKYRVYPSQHIIPQKFLSYAFDRREYMMEAAKAPIREAIRNWASASLVHHFNELPTAQINSAHIRISFHRGDHGDGHDFDGQKLAHTLLYYPPNHAYTEIHFDADLSWATNMDPTSFDIYTVALHEMGHVLGLNHSDVREAVMFPSIDVGVRRYLHPDDRAGIRFLYPLDDVD